MALFLDSGLAEEQICPNSFGYFKNAGKEFVVTDLATPMPWVNVMSNGKYGLVVSQAGGGFCWGDNSQVARITRWDQDLVQDRQGRFVYLQEADDREQIWSTTLQPTLFEADSEETTHGLGYSVFSRTVREIRSDHTVFVAESSPCEVWVIKLRNLSRSPRRLRIASYLEWHLGNSCDWHREFHRLFYCCGHEQGFLHARKLAGLNPDSRQLDGEPILAFHGAHGFEANQWIADKASFLGNPADVARPGLLLGHHNPAAENPRWNDPIAAVVGEIALNPGEEKTVAFTIGGTRDIEEARALAHHFSVDAAESELRRVKERWAEFCERSSVETDDPAFDLLNNYWLKYQTLAARMNARCAYYQQGGAYGFRDQLQDSLGMLSLDASLTKKQIILHAEATYADAGVRHWWHPNTDIFADSHHSDTCLWIPYAVLAYLDETNDIDLLETPCRYLDRESGLFASEGSLLDHCLRGIERALTRRSARGLPLIFAGDWNDGLSHAGIEGKGESVWLGMFLFDILSRWIPVLNDAGEHLIALRYEEERQCLKDAVNRYGWDGQWFLQGTRDDGNALGSVSCAEGKIFLNPQAWSVISGVASADRAERALDSACEHLIKPYGALLLSPAFSKVDPYVGYITRYAPGLRENGGVYSHASVWMIQALAMARRVDAARDLYRAMVPCNGRCASSYAAEPYVMPGNVDGPDSPLEGRAGWTWYTGSAAWMQRTAFDWICGIRATRKGLLVDCVSGSTPLGFKMVRRFRGDAVHVEVSGVGTPASIVCETAELREGMLISSGTGAVHRVRVELA